MPAGLSGGQKKRVGVARATVTRAPIVLYDEPAAGLDPVTSQKIFELLRAEQRAANDHGHHGLERRRAAAHGDRSRRHDVPGRADLRRHHAAKRCTSSDPCVHQFVHGLTEGPL